MIALVKKALPGTDYYTLLAGKNVKELWETVKDNGLLEHYRSAFGAMECEEQGSDIIRFDNRVRAGEVSLDEFASYSFPLCGTVYSCCGAAETREEADALLYTLQDEYLIETDYSNKYDEVIDTILYEDDEGREKKIGAGGITFMVKKEYSIE